MSSIHGLRVNCRVPVRVIEYDRVSRRQVDAQATGARRQQEDEDLWPCLEVVHRVSTILEFRASVKATVFIVAVSQVLFHQVNHSGHLEIEEDSVPSHLELPQQ